jgi:hypothetical protein
MIKDIKWVKLPKMCLVRTRALTCFIIISLILIAVSPVSSELFSNHWDLGNNTSLSFSEEATFAIPHQSVQIDDTLTSYWKMNEGYGTITNDSIINQEYGNVSGALWVTGKYGNALYFDGIDDSLNISSTLVNHTAGALSLWVYSSANFTGKYANEGQILGLSGNQYMSYLGLKESGSAYSLIGETNKNEEYFVSGSSTVLKNSWNHILINFVEGTATTYVNGLQVDKKVGLTKDLSLSIVGLTSPQTAFCGSVDEILIYNRALTTNEIKVLFCMGEQPDPISFSKFYNFTDFLTNETMLICIEKLEDDTGSANVQVSSFFSDNRLVFESNNTVTFNVWTTLGQPKSILNGFWNIENFTSTFRLNSLLTAELDWSLGGPPSASNLSVSSAFAGEKTVFSVFWRDNKSLSGGGYIFSSNNTGIWTNSSWVPFFSYPSWANFTLNLSNTPKETVSFREFANNSLGLWGDSGLYSVAVKNNVIPPTSSPAPSAISSPTLQPTPKSSPTIKPPLIPSTQKPITSPTPIYNFSFSTNYILLLSSAVTIFVVFLALAFKKGYISIEVSSEETSIGFNNQNEEKHENHEDYTI